MKASAFIAIILAFALIFPAVSQASNGCRETAPDATQDFSPVQLVQQDLVHGIWTKQLPDGGRKIFFFHSSGKAEIIAENASGSAVFHPAEWQTAQAGERVLLILKEGRLPQEKRFRVQQTCEGVVLTDMKTGEVSRLAYQPLADAAQLNSLKNRLAGQWTNVSKLSEKTKNDNLKTAFLQLHLRQDGTFHSNYGTKTKKAEESGTWEVSANGQFLLLHIGKGAGQQTKVAKIVLADEESLVLECLQGLGFCQFFGVEVASLAFIK